MNEYEDPSFEDGRSRPSRGGNSALARARTSAPGLILIILGVFGIFTSLGLIALSQNMGEVRNWLKSIADKQPPGKQKDQLEERIKEMEAADTPEGRLANSLIYGGTAFTSLMIVIGGLKMRSLNGFPLAVVGSVLAIIPLNGCCCLTTPFGIWGLITLLNPDVRAGFGSQTGRDPSSEDY